ncbi:hypothetical protein LQZ19_03735 [Treponema primitia]|uniref:hypothetical protein n=1 Tax=Treponema primitia TaxID=88058 RepID=UPI003980AD10
MLISYGNKEHTPYIDSEAFISFVEKYARHYANEQPEWAIWAKDTSRKIWEEMTPLLDSEKCMILTEKTGTRIYMRNFYIDLLENAYASPDDSAGLPFPSENSLKIKVPPEHLKSLNVKTDLVTYLEHPQTERMPLIMLVFPPGIPNALSLSTMIPRRLMESAMLKVRHFLRTQDNKDYLQNKLIPHYQGRENQLRDIFNRMMVRPLDCLTSLEDGEDFPYLFWASFCGLVRSDITKRQELLNEDIAVLQSLHIIEIINNYYRALSFKKKERDMALNDLALQFDQPPYAYSMDTILKFINSKGVPLLGLYSEKDLEDWLTVKLKSSNAEELPEILLITGPTDAKRYIKKIHYYDFSVNFLTEARPLIKRAVSDRWLTIIKAYRRESAMEKDEDFEKLLKRFVGELAPELMAVITDKKLYLVCDEIEQIQGFIPEGARFFVHGGALLPLATILLIKRKEILADTRALLPFWYSIPLFIALIAFFQKLKNIKLKIGKKKNVENDIPEKGRSANKNQDKEIKEAGRKLESELVPYGDDIDTYLENLANRWNTLLKQQAREDLLTDVKTLIRDRLRQVLHGQRHMMLTRDSLEKLARRIADENSTLRDLKNQDNLRQYIVLYMVKLLIHSNF